MANIGQGFVRHTNGSNVVGVYMARDLDPMSAGFSNTKSLLLDGVDEYVNIDSVQTALASTTVGTWSCWIKPVDATPASNETFLSFGDENGDSIFRLQTLTTGVLQAFVRDAGVTQWQVRTDATAFSDNTWAHVALVQNATQPVLYVNGSAVAQSNTTATDLTFWFNDTSALDVGRIGCTNTNTLGNVNLFTGNIDEVLFINAALDASAISDIYNSGCPKNESGISNGVSYFRMGDAGDTITTFTDRIGSNNATGVNLEAADIETDTIC